MAGNIDFVPDLNDRDIFRKISGYFLVGTCGTEAGIEQMQDNIGFSDFIPGTFYTDAFDFIFRCIGANSGRIDQGDRNSFELDGFRDLVTCRPGNRGDNGDIGTGQDVE